MQINFYFTIICSLRWIKKSKSVQMTRSNLKQMPPNKDLIYYFLGTKFGPKTIFPLKIY